MRATSFPHYGKPGVTWKTVAAKYLAVKLIDPLGREVTGVGEVGELVYKGPGVMAGYYKAPELTKNAFTEDGFLRTGDIFRIEENDCISPAQTYFGLLYCADRIAQGNEAFLKTMEDFGFDWFKEYRPPAERET